MNPALITISDLRSPLPFVRIEFQRVSQVPGHGEDFGVAAGALHGGGFDVGDHLLHQQTPLRAMTCDPNGWGSKARKPRLFNSGFFEGHYTYLQGFARKPHGLDDLGNEFLWEE